MGDPGHVGRPGIIMANEPRAYREVIAAAFRALRPGLAIMAIEPDELDGHLTRLPRSGRWLVVHSRRSPVVQAGGFAWVLLHPDGEAHAAVNIAGRQTTIADIQLDDLLAILDQAVAPAHAGPTPAASRT
jgi:hypothetical protein